MPDSVVIVLIIIAGQAIAWLWTRHCRRVALRDHQPDQRLNCTVTEFRRANLGSAYGPAEKADGWEQAGGDPRYASQWLKREVRP